MKRSQLAKTIDVGQLYERIEGPRPVRPDSSHWRADLHSEGRLQVCAIVRAATVNRLHRQHESVLPPISNRKRGLRSGLQFEVIVDEAERSEWRNRRAWRNGEIPIRHNGRRKQAEGVAK